ncbi:hypothetical protein FOA43_000770 [Brettanomyces nanus]|uniref:Cell wall mannoprotein PIR1-like C-terminal domain-containing protein n=1 Tax=Eeniella nana TaxID=13502 RepID=A0A875S0R4_EENNA|nr:uncharacterized protein FOA43_000770 [Brettanomyces nanus]QPG73459.1 hypothetical protein FOA43_000770 [Brettanomyces nanus]
MVMKSSTVLTIITALASYAAAGYVPTAPWSTLTPTGTISGATTDYASTFGIAIESLTTSNSSLAKRAVATQIGDGQVQATTKTASSTSTKNAKKTSEAVVSQIGDGQVQAATSTKAATSKKITSTATAAAVVSQISDGQIQATTATKSATKTATVASQISDGQIQATTKTTSVGASQITDGQIQASSTSAASSLTSSDDASVESVACYNEGDLALNLNASILTDAKGRIGSIVANQQFQFDGPPPQAGAIYAAGWSITADGYLAIGDNTEFWQCLSGTFYNLYDESIGGQCHAVLLKIVNLTNC